MDRFRGIRIRAGSWPVMAGVCCLAVLTWGLYAWRFSGGTPPEAGNTQAVTHADAADSTHTGVEDRVTPLRAERPVVEPGRPMEGIPLGPSHVASAGSDRAATDVEEDMGRLSVAVTANAPPLAHPEAEMILHEAPRPPVEPAVAGLSASRAALDRGDLLAARGELSAALRRRLGPLETSFARGELERIAEKLLFSRTPISGDTLTGVHVVAGGETLSAIAQRYKVTPALLVAVNRLANPNRIRVGARLKVIHGPFNAVISKSKHRLDITLGDVFVRSFQVGLGTNGGTPVGTWTVRDKLKNPEWTDPATGRRYLADDPDNPVGERWIGLHGIAGEGLGRVGFGIHGTIDPASIGENFSMGCVRLLPDDVAVVYDLLVNGHSRVIIE